MSNRVMLLLCLFVSALMVAGPGLVVVADGGEGGDRSGGDRFTDIDGQHKDTFDNDRNLTVFGDAWVKDGALTIDRSVRTDEFNRVQIAPWTRLEGSASIVDEVLWTNATDMANATVSVPINLHDLELFLDLSPGLMTSFGPYVTLRGPNHNVSFRYNHQTQTVALGLQEGMAFNTLKSTTGTLTSGDWYEARMHIEGDLISFSIGPVILDVTFDIQANFTSMELTSAVGESASWDNVTVNKIGGRGFATSDPVNKPDDTYWDTLQIHSSKPYGTKITVSLLDASTGAPIEGLEDITRTVQSVTELIDPMKVTGVKLYVSMETNGTMEPRIASWTISWFGDQPRFIKPLPRKVLYEDEPEEGVIDLRSHFADRLTHVDNLTYTVSFISNSNHVYPVVDGYMLGFELPTENWYGTENYTISCSDGVLSVESALAEVEVKPLNDPPTVERWERQEVDENQELVFNMTPYLDDVDTPIEKLTVRTTSSRVTIESQVLRVTYDIGGFLDKIVLEVSDGVNAVSVILEVTVYNIDDPPVIADLDVFNVDEDEETTIDMSEYISDEDTDMEWLTLNLPDGDSHISADGLVITLFYPTRTGEFLYTVEVSDGTSTVSEVIEVFVSEVNDPPDIAKVGDEVPDENDIVHVNVTEGFELTLVLEIDNHLTHFHSTNMFDLSICTSSMASHKFPIVFMRQCMDDHIHWNLDGLGYERAWRLIYQNNSKTSSTKNT